MRFLGVGSEPMADANAFAMIRNNQEHGNSLQLAAQAHMQKKQLQAQEDAQMRALGMESQAMQMRAQQRAAEMSQQDRQFNSSQNFQGSQADAQRNYGASQADAARQFTGGQAGLDRSARASEFGATNDRLLGEQNIERTRNDALNNQTNSMVDVMKGNAAVQHAGAQLGLQRGNYEFQQQQRDPSQLINGMMYDALSGAAGGGPPGAPPTPPPPPPAQGPINASFDAGDSGDSGAANVSQNPGDMMPPQQSTQGVSPMSPTIANPKLQSMMDNPLVRKMLGMQSPDQQNFQNQMNQLTLQKATREANGEMAPAQKQQRSQSELAKAMQDAQQYQLQYHLDPTDAASRALMPINAIRRQRGEPEFALGDVAGAAPPSDTSAQGIQSQLSGTPFADSGALYKGAMDDVVTHDPGQQSIWGSPENANENAATHYLGNTVAGLFGSKAPGQDPSYQAANKAAIMKAMMTRAAGAGRSFSPQQLEAIVAQNATRAKPGGL